MCIRSRIHTCFSYRSLIDLIPIGFDHMFIPVEGVFADPLQSAVTLIIAVYVNKAIALTHLTGPGRDQIDASPHGIAHEFYAVQIDGFFHGADILAQIVDAVIVMDLSVHQFVCPPNAVFYDPERLIIWCISNESYDKILKTEEIIP